MSFKALSKQHIEELDTFNYLFFVTRSDIMTYLGRWLRAPASNLGTAT